MERAAAALSKEAMRAMSVGMVAVKMVRLGAIAARGSALTVAVVRVALLASILYGYAPGG